MRGAREKRPVAAVSFCTKNEGTPARRTDVELWSVEECHFQQHGSRCRMWVPPQIKDPILQHAPTRKSVACFGAVNLSTAQFVRMMCKFNALTFQRFLSL